MPVSISVHRAALFLCLSLPAPALGQAGPNVLTAAQVAAFDQLVSAAKQVDPTYLSAQVAEIQKRAELSPLGAVSVSASSTLSLGLQNGFDQVASAFRLSAGVDLLKLGQAVTKSNAPKIAQMTNSTSAAGRDLRVRVLQAYAAYLSAVRGAGVASDALEVASAALNQQQARAAAGTVTGVDVLKAAQERNRADAGVYDANLQLAVSKQQVAAVTGLTLSALDKMLSGAKPRP